MTTTPPPPPPGAGPQTPPGPSGTDTFFDGIRRTGLVRSEERWVGGVAGGIALRLGIDPLLVRGLLAVTVLLGGLGLVLYGAGWALLPEQRDGRIHLQELFRGHFDVAVLGAFAVLATGLSFPDRWNPGLWWTGGSGWWQALLWTSAVVLVVVLVVQGTRDRRPGGPVPPGHVPPPGPPGSGPVPPGPTTGAPGHPGPTPAGPVPPAPGTGPSAPGPTSPTTSTGTSPLMSTDHTTTAAVPPSPAAWAAGPGPSTWSGGPTGPGAPSTGWSAQRPAATPPPPAPRRPSGPGAGTVGVVVALTLLTLAGLMYAERVGAFDGPVVLIAGATGVVLAGLGIILAGLRGRTSGALGGLAVVGILVLLPVSAAARADITWTGGGTVVGDVTRTPTTVAEAERGYSVGAGEARIDLTELPASRDTVVVPVNVGAGEITVIVPEGSAYDADVRIFAGEITWLGDRTTRAGAGQAETFESEAVADGAEAEIHLEITVGAGEVRVIEQ